MTTYSYGYPEVCTKCQRKLPYAPELRVKPFYVKRPRAQKLMLIGQDPTIYKDPQKVKQALMLDEVNGQISRWLRNLFQSHFNLLTIYATNLVKCTFSEPPSFRRGSVHKFLQPYFLECSGYLKRELLSYKPSCVLTLGEPSHILFRTLLDNNNEIPKRMKQAFTGRFFRARIEDHEFDYSPCLHITTFRVAETYGRPVKLFKRLLRDYFLENDTR